MPGTDGRLDLDTTRAELARLTNDLASLVDELRDQIDRLRKEGPDAGEHSKPE